MLLIHDKDQMQKHQENLANTKQDKTTIRGCIHEVYQIMAKRKLTARLYSLVMNYNKTDTMSDLHEKYIPIVPLEFPITINTKDFQQEY